MCDVAGKQCRVLGREKPVSAEQLMGKPVINQIESSQQANDFLWQMKEQGFEVQGRHPFSKTKEAYSKESPRRATRRQIQFFSDGTSSQTWWPTRPPSPGTGFENNWLLSTSSLPRRDGSDRQIEKSIISGLGPEALG
jgi:hypothetical protein